MLRKIPRRTGAFAALYSFPLLVVLFLAGCAMVLPTPGPTEPPPTPTQPPATPTATPPAGMSFHRTAQVQIALPDSWKQITLDDATLKQEIDAATTDNPHLADALRGILAIGQNKSMLFYGADPSSPGDILQSVTIVKSALAPAGTAEQVASDFANNLPNVVKGAKLVMFEPRMQIGGRNAGEVDYEVPLVNTAGRVVRIRGVQFVVVAGHADAYVVTLTGDAAREADFVPLARTIGRTFSLTAP